MNFQKGGWSNDKGMSISSEQFKSGQCLFIFDNSFDLCNGMHFHAGI